MFDPISFPLAVDRFRHAVSIFHPLQQHLETVTHILRLPDGGLYLLFQGLRLQQQTSDRRAHVLLEHCVV